MKLKTLLTAAIILFTIQMAFSQLNSPLPAAEILNAALKKAKSEKRSVLLMFHASWCGWCHKMDASLKDPSIKPYFDKNYIIADIVVYESKGKENLENPGAVDLLKKYNNADQGLPTWLIFDAKGSLIADSQMRPEGVAQTTKGENVGCPAKQEEVAYFVSALKKSSRLNEKELEDITTIFRKNEIKR